MTIVHIIVAVLQAILRVLASALQAGAVAVGGALVAIALLLALGFAGVSGLGAMRLAARRRKKTDGDRS